MLSVNQILANYQVRNPNTNRQINSIAGKKKLIKEKSVPVPNLLLAQNNGGRVSFKLANNANRASLGSFIQTSANYYTSYVDVYTDDIFEFKYIQAGRVVNWTVIYGTIKDVLRKANLPVGNYRMIIRADDFDQDEEKIGVETLANQPITVWQTIKQTTDNNILKFLRAGQSGVNNFLLDSQNLQSFNDEEHAFANIRVIFIKPSQVAAKLADQIRKVEQKFKIGDFNCVLIAMLNTVEKSIEKCEDKPKYVGRLQNIKKEIVRLNDCYKDGLTYEDIEKILKDLPFTVRIYDLILQNYVEFKHKSPIFNVKYVNTTFNHVEQLIDTKPVYSDALYKKYETGTLPYFKQGGFITPEGVIRKEADEYINEMFLPFTPMIETDPSDFSKDFAHVINSIHYFSSWIDYNKKLTNLTNIDMPKCYANFKQCDYYKGFPSVGPQITGELTSSDFNNYKDLEGFITIYNVNYDNCDQLIKDHINKIKLFEIDNLTFPIPELRYYSDIGITFKCRIGSFCYGGNIDVPITENILKHKVYQKFTGIAGSHNSQTKYTIKSDKTIIQKLAIDYNYEYYDIPETDTAFINVAFDKKEIKSYPHVCAYMLSYARIRQFKQLFTIPTEHIRGIIADDIILDAEYQTVLYNTHSYEKFNNETSKKLVEKANCQIPAKQLLSSYSYYVNYHDTDEIDIELLKNISHKRIHAYGGPGNGKSSYYLRIADIFNKLVYVTDNHRQLQSKNEEYDVDTETIQRLIDSPFQNYTDIRTILLDEYSKITNDQIKKLLNKYPNNQLIVCGDKLQLPPCDGKQYDFFTDDSFHHIHFETNYRFQDDDLRKLASDMRNVLESKIKNSFKIMKCRSLMNTYPKISLADITDDHVILTSKNEKIDAITEKLLRLKPKYMVKKTTKDHKLLAGQIVTTYPEEYKNYVKLQHAFTIHSYQGETLSDKQKLVIDMADHFDAHMLYVQITRCKHNTQIFILEE